MDSLDKLTLNSNQLTHLRGGMFEGLTSLRALYIDHNQISTINKEAFKGLEGKVYICEQDCKVHEQKKYFKFIISSQFGVTYTE